MTGEVTLQGRVLPIGGLKQKVLAAHAAGLTEVILPERNRADLDDVPADVREQMTFHPVMSVDEVLALALGAGRVGCGAGRCRRGVVAAAPSRWRYVRAAELLERRWSLATIYACHSGAARFNEFRQAASGHLPQHVVGAPRAAGDRGRDRAQPEPRPPSPQRVSPDGQGSPARRGGGRPGGVVSRRTLTAAPGDGSPQRERTSSSSTRPPISTIPSSRGRARIREPAPWRMSSSRPSRADEGDRRGSGGLVLGDPVARGEDPLANDARGLVDPRPNPDRVVALRRPFEGLDIRRRSDLHELELAATTPGGRRRRSARRPCAPEPRRPAGAARRPRRARGPAARPFPPAGCPANGSSTAGVKMRISPRSRVVDEHRLAEAELGGDPLPMLRRDLGSVEEDPERIAPAPALAAEDAKHVQLGHCVCPALRPSAGSGGAR